jgi:hypothetical protein
MRTKLIGAIASLLLLPVFSVVSAQAAKVTIPNGIQTTDLNSVGTTPQSLATELAGLGVTVSNVVYKGANAQAGTIVNAMVAAWCWICFRIGVTSLIRF